MAQQTINIGTTANDGTGDTWRDAFDKSNDNFDELYVRTAGATFVSQESDFPSQDASTITLEANTVYIVNASFSVSKRFVVESGASITARNLYSHKLTFAGTGTMFTGSDVQFYIHDLSIDAGAANEVFDFTDTVGGVQRFLCLRVICDSSVRVGQFTDMALVEFSTCAFTSTQGIEVFGTSNTIWSFDRLALISSSASFIGINLGSAQAAVIEFTNMFFSAPAGAYGISGLASNGNIPSGSLAMVKDSEFVGGMTALQNITNTDTRWLFKDNTPIPDTIADCMVSLNSNATETVISTINTPVLVAGTWTVERQSLFTGTTGGRATYEAERDIVVPVDITATISAASGTNKDITVYAALNGTVITNSGKSNKVGSGDPKNTSVLWQLNLSEDDYLEVYVENNTDTVNLVVEDCILRVR